MLSFAFYTYRKRQSVIFSLYPAPKTDKPMCKSRTQIKTDATQRAMRWQALIGTNGISSRADLA